MRGEVFKNQDLPSMFSVWFGKINRIKKYRINNNKALITILQINVTHLGV